MTTDLLATSAETWRDRSADPPVIPDALRPPRHAGPRERNRALWQRHDLRRQRAEDVYAASRNPVRGWPVSGNRAVLAFFGDLVRGRKGSFALMVALNALAAGAALVVPRLLGALVNRVESQGAGVEGLDTLALAVVGVVLLQALFTFGAQRTSTHFGQDLLASAREYIVGTILRLPVGRVEGASTGDLVTRVTRDVGTMARTVQWGVPRLLISLMTVVLSVAAMLLNSVVLAVPALLVFAMCAPAVRTYLRRAPKAYITEGATYSRINTTLTETVEGARTVEALGLS
ncbi:MAG: ABC transporter transmembrane domain-containing protein, partial [Terrabacter sp.]